MKISLLSKHKQLSAMSHTSKLKESSWLSEAIKRATSETSVSHPYLKRCQLDAKFYAWAEANRIDCNHKKIIRMEDKVEVNRAFMTTSDVPGPSWLNNSSIKASKKPTDRNTKVRNRNNINPYKLKEAKQRKIYQVSQKTTNARENFINIMSFEDEPNTPKSTPENDRQTKEKAENQS